MNEKLMIDARLKAGQAAKALAPLEHFRVSAFSIPTDYPESDGTIRWNKSVLVLAEVFAGGRKGLGYTFADISTAHFIYHNLYPLLSEEDAFDIPFLWHKMIHEVRNLGQCGIAMMAISAVDNALWDLKARLLDLPLVRLLGKAREQVPVYGSGGFTSYHKERLQHQLRQWAEEGIFLFKIKIGREPWADVQRVKDARDAIGNHAELFVDANGAYTRKQSLSMAERFADYGVSWFEEPVPSSDLEGLRLLRDRAPAGMDISAGEYGYTLPYFREMLKAGAVDALQADASRCGGISGFLAAAKLSEAFEIPLSSHCCPAQHLHAACALQGVRHMEYFYDHARIENMLFYGVIQPRNGYLDPDLSRAGIGLELKEADAKPFLIFRNEYPFNIRPWKKAIPTSTHSLTSVNQGSMNPPWKNG